MPRLSRFTGTRFLCAEPPAGFGIRFYVADDKSVYAHTTFGDSKEGGVGILHGGAISAVLDEAMGTACYEAHSAGYTATMTYHFASHIPLHQKITIRAWVNKIDGKKMYSQCSATLADGTVAVTGEGLFIASASLQKLIVSNPYIPENE
ncbi:MAG: PaaI family thioesterase [Chloroflexota bacterium]